MNFYFNGYVEFNPTVRGISTSLLQHLPCVMHMPYPSMLDLVCSVHFHATACALNACTYPPTPVLLSGTNHLNITHYKKLTVGDVAHSGVAIYDLQENIRISTQYSRVSISTYHDKTSPFFLLTLAPSSSKDVAFSHSL